MSLAWLPNALTLARCLLAVLVGWAILKNWQPAFLPLILFIGTALTDFIDGFLARRLNAISALGAFLDPVADKLLVAFSLLAICNRLNYPNILLAASIVIIIRDLGVTILRLKPGLTLPVSMSAKWKTATEMVGISALLLGLTLQASPIINAVFLLGYGLVIFAACMSAYTGYLYARSARNQTG